MSLSSAAFSRLVASLKRKKATCTVVESCCGGIISSSIMAQPGASSVYYGGSVAYNTRKAKPLLLNDNSLHAALTSPLETWDIQSEGEMYVQSKLNWTSRTAKAFCEQMGTDFAIAEGGAAGPTFRPADLDKGFAAVAIAARESDTGVVKVVRQEVVRSSHANREANMRLFADAAARLALDAIQEGETSNPDVIDTGEGKTFEVHTLDRATKLRSDAEALAALALEAQYVVLRGSSALFRDGCTELSLLSLSQVESLCAATGSRRETTFLGLVDGSNAVFGVDLLPEGNADSLDGAVARLEEKAVFADTRTGAPLLSPTENELVLHATALAQWQRRAPFCSSCGALMKLVDGGTCRKCSSCGTLLWPRQDPSIIAVVMNREEDKVLLARSKRHPARMHTALAGFVEAGETFENAVAREVYEETGVRIDRGSVQYVGSQPWPFPQSTMIGFSAVADDAQQLNLDMDELVEAAWFDKDQVRAAANVEGPVMQAEVAEAALLSDPSLQLLIPPKRVLARTLIDTWLDKHIL